MRYVIGLGSNLGSRRAFLRTATALIEAAGGRVQGRSAIYETDPVGPDQPDYLNAAISVDWPLDPPVVLATLGSIEASLLRDRRGRWGPRTIDLDILWWEGGAVNDEALRVPHVELERRIFALLPLFEAVQGLDLETTIRAQFGDRLAALTSRSPSMRSLPPDDVPMVAATEAGASCRIDATEPADAMAAAMAAVGRHLAPRPEGARADDMPAVRRLGRRPPRRVAGDPREIGNDLRAWAVALEGAMPSVWAASAAGMAVEHAAVGQGAPPDVEVVLVGRCCAPVSHPRPPTVRVAAEDRFFAVSWSPGCP